MKLFIFIIASLFIFSACTNNEEIQTKNSINVQEIIDKKKEKKTNSGTSQSTIVYQKKEINNNQITNNTEKEIQDLKTVSLEIKNSNNHITLTLLNPKKNTINGARTWLAFPVNTLKVSNLKLNTTLFDLIAPNEDEYDKENGIIKIGLTSSKGIKNTQIPVASFDVKNRSRSPVPLNCYDYSDETNSHCTVISSNRKNILKQFQGFLIQ